MCAKEYHGDEAADGIATRHAKQHALKESLRVRGCESDILSHDAHSTHDHPTYLLARLQGAAHSVGELTLVFWLVIAPVEKKWGDMESCPGRNRATHQTNGTPAQQRNRNFSGSRLEAAVARGLERDGLTLDCAA